MENNIFFAKDFEIRSNQTFFFDNNIWMLLFCPISNVKQDKQNTISKFFEKVLTYKNLIFINGLILSEFSNAYLRLDFRLWKDETRNYNADFKKDFFETKRAVETRKVIAETITSKILKVAQKCPDSLNSVDFEKIFEYYKKVDYNDSFIYYECKAHKWILVSDDSDFNLFEDGLLIIKP